MVAGQLKFMVRYALSSHGAAACVIARRGLGFRLERTVSSSVLFLPDRERAARGNYWLRVCKRVKKMTYSNRTDLLYADRF